VNRMIRNMNDDDLKSCPCCGGKAFFVVEPSVYSNSFFYFIACDDCGIETLRTFRTKEAAARVWNKRVS
jgi:Lar family restriction alleviation protein